MALQEGRSISLREQQQPPALDHDLEAEEFRTTGGQGPPDIDETALTRRKGLGMARARVLIGNGILQLPIWEESGFAMSYGVFQEYLTTTTTTTNKTQTQTLKGSQSATGLIGTTFNGVMYISMPFLFALLARTYARHRRAAALAGAALACLGFALSSLATRAWHLVASQGVLAALGCALVYSPTTLSLGEWFSHDGGGVGGGGGGVGGGNRALAYGVTLSCKNIVGSACPFLLRVLLDRYGFRTAVRIWAALVAGTSVPAVIFLVPTHPSRLLLLLPPSPDDDTTTTTPSGSSRGGRRRRRRVRMTPWHFLRHGTIYVYALATALQSSGYGIPQTYLATYARDVAALSTTSATLLLTVFNLPGIVSSAFFGYLSNMSKNRYNPNNNNNNNNNSSNNNNITTDTNSSQNNNNDEHNNEDDDGSRVSKRRFTLSLSASAVTLIPALGSALSALLLWGLTSRGSTSLLVLFSATFGFFAGGYSATWGGVLDELEREAGDSSEAVDTGLLYGLLNGARGVGYVGGGLAGVPLLSAGGKGPVAGGFGYGSAYGPLIIFTGVSSVFGGWAVLWRWGRLLFTA
ncbi:hypothetical protein VPNG_02912 [Cytospora leucostoma]|uniref:Major facilitator superfamily (MFS) profile domain-containing protein n=1 Tax=Cytospora leucostoma TaxID=1230097 RepID=A0A423XG54_9PEZI|nr:hypothetical protein VPNG_02912 [Cytospora leucostoma]